LLMPGDCRVPPGVRVVVELPTELLVEPVPNCAPAAVPVPDGVCAMANVLAAKAESNTVIFFDVMAISFMSYALYDGDAFLHAKKKRAVGALRE
jgi:hypothetical protein